MHLEAFDIRADLTAAARMCSPVDQSALCELAAAQIAERFPIDRLDTFALHMIGQLEQGSDCAWLISYLQRLADTGPSAVGFGMFACAIGELTAYYHALPDEDCRRDAAACIAETIVGAQITAGADPVTLLNTIADRLNPGAHARLLDTALACYARGSHSLN